MIYTKMTYDSSSSSESSVDSSEDGSNPPFTGFTPRMQKIILNGISVCSDNADNQPTLSDIMETHFGSESDSDSDFDSALSYSKYNYRLKDPPMIKTDEPRGILYVALKAEERSNCAICMSKFERTDPLVRLRCRDVFHAKCYEEWQIKSYRCPKCLKTVDDQRADMEFNRLERAIEEVQEDDMGEKISIICIDCETEFEDRKNPIKNRCNVCGSYNTH
jgi:DNA-directed RNA polymerase subunit RPC12/RpoP